MRGDGKPNAGHKTKQWAETDNKSSAEVGDSYLWIHHYKHPLLYYTVIRFIVVIKMSMNAALRDVWYVWSHRQIKDIYLYGCILPSVIIKSDPPETAEVRGGPAAASWPHLGNLQRGNTQHLWWSGQECNCCKAIWQVQIWIQINSNTILCFITSSRVKKYLSLLFFFLHGSHTLSNRL